MSIDKRAFSKEKLSSPSPLPYISRRSLKLVKHPMPIPNVCSECGGQIELVENSEIYNGRSYGDWPFAYLCRPCDAYVGLHPNTDIPLGTLANKSLRKKRKTSKAVFHTLVHNNGGSRTHWYHELAKHMNIEVDQCHFGMFDLEQCNQALIACRALFPKNGNQEVKQNHIDIAYFKDKLEVLLRDIHCYENSSGDLARVLTRLAVTSDEQAVKSEINLAWRPIETAPSDTEVRVGWYEDGEWYESIDTFEDGEFWINHANHYEHFCAVRIPEMTGPKETPPYTHWIPLVTPPEKESN